MFVYFIHKFNFILLYMYVINISILFYIFYFAGNGETTGGGKNKNGKYSFWKSFTKLFFPEWKNRYESQTKMGR